MSLPTHNWSLVVALAFCSFEPLTAQGIPASVSMETEAPFARDPAAGVCIAPCPVPVRRAKVVGRRGSRAAKGALIGFGVGFATGVALFEALCREHDCTTGEALAVGGLAGAGLAGIGAGIGALTGRSRGRRGPDRIGVRVGPGFRRGWFLGAQLRFQDALATPPAGRPPRGIAPENGR